MHKRNNRQLEIEKKMLNVNASEHYFFSATSLKNCYFTIYLIWQDELKVENDSRIL